MMTKEQAERVIQNALIEKAKRKEYNKKRWATKKADLIEAVSLINATEKAKKHS